jgi:hypothetical protein
MPTDSVNLNQSGNAIDRYQLALAKAVAIWSAFEIETCGSN